jgi:two-component system OmpR family response regulator
MADEKVLLVDDEMDFVQALSARLETRGLVVQTASSGQEAIDKAKKESFDAVVLDLAMPGMDGIETLKALRDHDPDLQIILLTGHATLQKGVEAMKLGAMDFLEKPVDLNTLLDKVREARSKSVAVEQKKTDQIIQDILKTKGW